MRKQIKYRVMGLTMILAVLAGGSVQSFAEAASKESQDAKQDSLPQGLEWLTPFDETVKLDVVVGWSVDDSVKAGTTPETNSLVTIAKDYLNIELNFLWMVPDDQFEDRLALLLSSGELPDIVTVADDFYEFLDNDCLRDLTDAYEQCASEELKDVMTSLGDDLTNYCSKIAAHTRAKKIVYISCKPTSLVRDLVELQKYGYKMIRARSVDMFPNTGQIETVCELALVEDQQNNQQNDQ